MGILVWIVFGALVGWIASMIMKSNQGVLADIIIGIIGAFVGGLIMSLLGQPSVSGFNLYSIVVAVIGASVTIFLYRAISRSAA